MSKSINYNVKKRGGTWVLEDSFGVQIETSDDPQALQTLRQKLYREARALTLVKEGDGGAVTTGANGDPTISTKTGLTEYDLEGQKKRKTPRTRKTLSDPEGVLSPDEMAGIADAMSKNWEGPDAASLIAGQDDTLRKTDKFKRCVAHVIDSGKSEDAAYAICTSVLGPHGKGKESQKMRVVSDLRKFSPPGAPTTIARYAPFDMTKRDDEQQIVIGITTSERIDGQDEIVDPAAFKAAIPDFMEWENLREMHENKAAGKVLSLEPIEGEVEIDGRKVKNPVKIVVKVLDKGAWEKVKAGVYKGFSIGGKVVDWINETINGQAVRRITDMILTEISLVDRPANEDARILMFKRATDDMPETVEIEWDQLGDGQYNYMDALTKTRSEIRPIPGGKFSVLIAKYDGAPVASFLADDIEHATLQAAHNLTVMRWRAGLAKTQAATELFVEATAETLAKAEKTLNAWDEMPSGELRATIDVADPEGDRTVYAIVYQNVNKKWVGGVYYDAKGDKAIRESAGSKERGEARDWVEEWVRTEKIARPAIKKVSVADFKPGASVTFTDAGEARSFFEALEKDANGGTALVDRPILNDVLDDFEKLGEGTLKVERGRQAAIITVANDDDSDGERIKVWLPESMMAYKLGKGVLDKFKSDARVKEVSDERDSDDGIWVYLKDGYCTGETGNHMVHEDTPREVAAAMKSVTACTCSQCTAASKVRKAADFATSAKQFVNSNPAGLPSEAHAPLLAPSKLVEDFTNQKQDLAESRDAKGLENAQRGYTRDYRDAVAEARDALNKIVADDTVPAETRQAALALLAIKSDRAVMRKYDIAQGDDVRHYISLTGYKVSRTDMRNLQGEFEKQKRANPNARIEINVKGFGKDGAEITLDVDGKTIKTVKGFQGSEVAYAAKPAMRKGFVIVKAAPTPKFKQVGSGRWEAKVKAGAADATAVIMQFTERGVDRFTFTITDKSGRNLGVNQNLKSYDAAVKAVTDKLSMLASRSVEPGEDAYADEGAAWATGLSRSARPQVRKAARRLTIKKAETFEFGRWQVDDAERMATSMGIADAPRIKDFIKTLQETGDRTATLALVVDEDAGYADATLTVGESRKDARVTLGIREKTMSTSKKPRTAIRKAGGLNPRYSGMGNYRHMEDVGGGILYVFITPVRPNKGKWSVQATFGDKSGKSKELEAAKTYDSEGDAMEGAENDLPHFRELAAKMDGAQKVRRPSVRKAAFPAGLVDGVNATIDQAIEDKGGYITAAMRPDYLAAEIEGDEWQVDGLPDGDSVSNYYNEDQLTKMVLKACEAKADADAAAAVKEYGAYKKSGSGLGTELHWRTNIGYTPFAIDITYNDDSWLAEATADRDDWQESFDTLVDAAKWGYEQSEKVQENISEQGYETADVDINQFVRELDDYIEGLDAGAVPADLDEAVDQVVEEFGQTHEFYGSETNERLKEEARRSLERYFDFSEKAAKPRFTKRVAGPKRVVRVAKADAPKVGDTVRVNFKKPHGMTQGAKFVIESINGSTVEFRGYNRKFDTSEITMTPVEKSARPITRKAARPAMKKAADWSSPGPGKFEGRGGKLAEKLHDVVMNGFADETLDFEDGEAYDLILDNTGVEEYGAAFILTNDSNGFVGAQAYKSEAEARAAWAKLEAEYEQVMGNGDEDDVEAAAKPKMKKARKPSRTITAALRTRRDPVVDALKRQVSKLGAALTETTERLEQIERQPANVPSPFVRPNPGIGKVLPGQGSTFQKPDADPRELINKRFADLVELRRIAATEPNPLRKADLNRQILIEEARLAQGGQ